MAVATRNGPRRCVCVWVCLYIRILYSAYIVLSPNFQASAPRTWPRVSSTLTHIWTLESHILIFWVLISMYELCVIIVYERRCPWCVLLCQCDCDNWCLLLPKLYKQIGCVNTMWILWIFYFTLYHWLWLWSLKHFWPPTWEFFLFVWLLLGRGTLINGRIWNVAFALYSNSGWRGDWDGDCSAALTHFQST